MKKIVLFIAHEGFQPVEYFEAKKVLDSAGFEVITASDKIGQAMPSAGTDFVDVVFDQWPFAIKTNRITRGLVPLQSDSRLESCSLKSEV